MSDNYNQNEFMKAFTDYATVLLNKMFLPIHLPHRQECLQKAEGFLAFCGDTLYIYVFCPDAFGKIKSTSLGILTLKSYDFRGEDTGWLEITEVIDREFLFINGIRLESFANFVSFVRNEAENEVVKFLREKQIFKLTEEELKEKLVSIVGKMLRTNQDLRFIPQSL